MVTGIQNWCTPRPDSSSTVLANMTINHFLSTVHLLCLIIDICFWISLFLIGLGFPHNISIIHSICNDQCIWRHTNLNKTLWTLTSQSLPVVLPIYILTSMNCFSDQWWTLPVSNGLKRMGFPPFFTLRQYRYLNYTTSCSEKALF